MPETFPTNPDARGEPQEPERKRGFLKNSPRLRRMLRVAGLAGMLLNPLDSRAQEAEAPKEKTHIQKVREEMAARKKANREAAEAARQKREETGEKTNIQKVREAMAARKQANRDAAAKESGEQPVPATREAETAAPAPERPVSPPAATRSAQPTREAMPPPPDIRREVSIDEEYAAGERAAQRIQGLLEAMSESAADLKGARIRYAGSRPWTPQRPFQFEFVITKENGDKFSIFLISKSTEEEIKRAIAEGNKEFRQDRMTRVTKIFNEWLKELENENPAFKGATVAESRDSAPVEGEVADEYIIRLSGGREGLIVVTKSGSQKLEKGKFKEAMENLIVEEEEKPDEEQRITQTARKIKDWVDELAKEDEFYKGAEVSGRPLENATEKVEEYEVKLANGKSSKLWLKPGDNQEITKEHLQKILEFQRE